VTAAQEDDGALWLLVLNLDRTNNLSTAINPLGFVNGGSASVWTVAPQSGVANNWDSHPNDVSTSQQTVPIASGRFTYTFPKHSVSVLRVPKATITGSWRPIREYTFTNATTASNIWYPADLQWWLAGKAATVSAAPLGDPNGFALRLVGEDPSHGRASLTLPASFTTGQLRLSSDIWFAGRRNAPLYVTIGDNARVPLGGLAFSNGRDGLVYSLNSNGTWQNTLCPFYQDNWQKLDLIVDLDSRKYEVLINGYKIFVGGEGRDVVSSTSNPINKVTFDTGATTGDAATFYIDNVIVSRFTTNAAPSISQVELRDNRFMMQVAGDVGPDYAIYSSANLRDWELLALTNPTSVPFKFVDPAEATTQRFYRIELGP
jgi:hypothetical protein